MNTNKDIEIRPQEGFQMSFASSNVDVVFGGGNLGGGKQQPFGFQDTYTIGMADYGRYASWF